MKALVSDILRYARVWHRSITLHFGVLTSSRADFFFFAGKVLRMAFFLVFFEALFSITPTIAGYTKGEVLLFFASMNILDVLVQLLWYRGLTILPNMVKRGDFDLILTKPVSPLFQVAFHIFDFFDLATIPFALGILAYAFSFLPTLTFLQWFGYIGFLCIGLILAFAVNLFLASLTLYAVESTNLWWMYRDLIYVARFPPEIFPSAVRIAFTYVIPILMIVSFSTKAALGRLSPALMLYAIVLMFLALFAALRFWKRGLRAYQSASS
jgi:ABC-2 type transport system permease protein